MKFKRTQFNILQHLFCMGNQDCGAIKSQAGEEMQCWVPQGLEQAASLSPSCCWRLGLGPW